MIKQRLPFWILEVELLPSKAPRFTNSSVYNGTMVASPLRMLGLFYVANDSCLHPTIGQSLFSNVFRRQWQLLSSCQQLGENHALERMATRRLPGVWRDSQVFRPELRDERAGLVSAQRQKKKQAVAPQPAHYSDALQLDTIPIKYHGVRYCPYSKLDRYP